MHDQPAIRRPIPRSRVLATLAALAMMAHDGPAAEGYMLELLAWCAFAERSGLEATA